MIAGEKKRKWTCPECGFIITWYWTSSSAESRVEIVHPCTRLEYTYSVLLSAENTVKKRRLRKRRQKRARKA